MFPAVVKFSGLSFDPKALLCRRVQKPTPAHWSRHQFTVEGWYHETNWQLIAWINSNLVGRYTLNLFTSTGGTLVVIGFEDDVDAVMFRLKEGETAWQDDTVSTF